MDKNSVIGLTLIFVLFVVWQQVMAPSAAELEEQQRLQDSIAQVRLQDSLARIALAPVSADSTAPPVAPPAAIPDSLRQIQLSGAYGPFSAAADGEEQQHTVENELMTITFSNKGGRIVAVELKDYKKVSEDEAGKEVTSPLFLLEDEKNRFEYLLPIAGLPAGGVRTGELYFDLQQQGSTVIYRADAGAGRYFEQRYTINPNTYHIDYDVRLEGLNTVLSNEADAIRLQWVNYLDKLEKNTTYERRYSTVYYKVVDDDPSYCSFGSDDSEELAEPVKWVSHSNQFFNSALIAENYFSSAAVTSEMLDEEAADLKKLTSDLTIPYNRNSSEVIAMDLYIGPNEFNRLRAMGDDLQDVIPFGWSIFGTINRWVIRPIFNFLSSFIGSAGIVILFLTLIVKLVLYPLTYKMLYSQSKMGALKPQLEGMRGKFKDDPQKQQMETMKLYREFGVNPLGGCLPMAAQMPIWFALYRFFPAAIEFRQAGFLWATDLSSYDVFMRLPFEIPLGFGSHLSLFTLLWAITTLIYTYYNTKDMDMSANPAMKYMQYIMPLFFLGFFNSFASGLTCYLLFSNLLNITQTIVTKGYIIDQDKIREEMEAYRKKPKKKKKGFQARLEAAMKEQQRIQQEREEQKRKGGKGRK